MGRVSRSGCSIGGGRLFCRSIQVNGNPLARRERVTITVTDSEKASIQAAAAAAGVSPNSFVRGRALGHGSSVWLPAAPALATLLRMSLRIETLSSDPELVDKLHRAIAELRPILLAELE